MYYFTRKKGHKLARKESFFFIYQRMKMKDMEHLLLYYQIIVKKLSNFGHFGDLKSNYYQWGLTFLDAVSVMQSFICKKKIEWLINLCWSCIDKFWFFFLFYNMIASIKTTIIHNSKFTVECEHLYCWLNSLKMLTPFFSLNNILTFREFFKPTINARLSF